MRNIEQLGEAFGASKGSLQLTYGKLVGGDWNMAGLRLSKNSWEWNVIIPTDELTNHHFSEG